MTETNENTSIILEEPTSIMNVEVSTIVKIDEIESIPVKISVTLKQFSGEKEGEPYNFEAYVTTIGDNEVRVPKTVISQLQAQCRENPTLEFFKVTKSGSGINTTYTVIPKLN